MYGQRRKESGRNFSLPMHGSLFPWMRDWEVGYFVSWFSSPTHESLEKQGTSPRISSLCSCNGTSIFNLDRVRTEAPTHGQREKRLGKATFSHAWRVKENLKAKPFSSQALYNLVPRPSLPPVFDWSVFAYCKQSKTGGREGLGTKVG